jgi:Ca-activated chloride channel family protein
LRTPALVAALILVVLLTPACALLPGGTAPSAPASPTASTAPAGAGPVKPLDTEVTLRVLGSNDLTDMQEVVAAATAATNVKLDITYVGSPAGAQTVASGKADGKYDAVWFASNAYLALEPKAAERVASSTKIMSSPVALGLEASVAKKLGWDAKPPTWSQIADAASAEEFRYGMSNPATSNAAFSALANVATALGGGSALRVSQVDSVAADLRRFFSAQSMTAESASFLVDRFAAQAGKKGAPQGLINYESKLISLNESGRLKRPLTVVIPADGVISADFPMALLNGVESEARTAYTVLTDWLRSPDGQRLIMEKTARRPIVGSLKPDPARFGDRLLIELPFPARRDVLDRLLTSYLNSTRRATQSIYVLDLSGSMAGERITALREALVSLAGGSGSISSSGYAVFRQRETVTLIGYGERVRKPETFTVPPGKDAKRGLARIRAAAQDLDSVPENTATYTALREAYQLADRQVRKNPGALTSIVLMTDGEQNEGIEEDDFRRFYAGLRAETQAVPTFTVKFGPADADELNRIARLTGGRLFAVENTRLVTAFRQIRAYQ